MAKVKMPTPDELTGMLKASGLKEKLIFTFAMIAVFRFGTQIPIFGIANNFFSNLANSNNLVGFLDMFTGGALGKVSIFGLGIGPYITASIIIQLLTAVIPHLESLQKDEGESGRRQLAQYTRYGTIGLAIFQSIMFLLYLSHQPGVFISGVSLPFIFVSGVVSLTAGSVFIMWLAELITEKGLGNGASLLIFISIISRIPFYISKTSKLVAPDPALQFNLVILLAVFIATIIAIVVMQEAMRKVIVVNAKRQVGNKVYGGVNTHIPFKLNPGGVMPIIFAIAILLFPSTMVNLLGKISTTGVVGHVISFLNLHILNPAEITYHVIYFGLIVLLSFFYASIMPNMQPKDIANNLKKYGSSIPGVKPGKPTAELLDKILTRIIFIGAIGLGLIALIPGITSSLTNITTLQGLGATSLIIMVGVALDFINQIKTHLLVRQYEGFLKQ